jgi:Mce-associated membrane protein
VADDVDSADRKLSVPTDSDHSCPEGHHGDDEPDRLDGDTDVDIDADATPPGGRGARITGIRLAVAVEVAAIAALGALGGWLGVNDYRLHQSSQQRAQFVRVGRQDALNLTTISYTDADRAVQRILDSATGAFHDDFQRRSGPFVDVVKQTQSTTVGTVTEAGVESAENDRARVLVAVSVTTTSPVQPAQPPHMWRMRITLEKVGGGAKMSDVAFVP